MEGRLEMPNIQVSHGGTYICQAVDYPGQSGSTISVYLQVTPSNNFFLYFPRNYSRPMEFSIQYTGWKIT